jgi:4-aminobutyrate aminotransferase/(S)-3-amino-2-methylpropionate transaminase
MSAIQLKTELPGPQSRALFARREAAVPRGPYNASEIFVKEGRGAVLTDVDDNQLLDFAGGIGCVNVGHANDEVVKAATAQLERNTHSCFHVTPNEA